ncbi:MAG: diaminopimelate decarboxylase family protein, partial [Candidatus Adiutrix sp.]
QLTDITPFAEAARRLRDLVTELKGQGISLKHIDLGGGLGISYESTEAAPCVASYARELKGVLKGLGLNLIVEPGRFIAGNSGVLLTKVLYNKKNGAKNFVVTDCAMNDLIRPSLYGAFHDIVPVKENFAQPTVVDVVGPVCESGDFMAKGRLIPPVAAGDLLAVKSAGAYGFTMSSNYNARPKAAEVLVCGSEYKVVRLRETYEDLLRGEF